MSKFLPRIVYLDDGRYYDRKVCRVVGRERAIEAIRAEDPKKFDSISTLEAYLEVLEESPVSLAEMRPPKKGDIDFKQLYLEAKPIMPFWHRSTIDGDGSAYSINSSNEATLLRTAEEGSFFNSLKAQKEVFEALYLHYQTDPNCQKIAKTVDFRQYAMKLLYYLEQDLERALDAEPVRLSWDKSQVAFKQFDPALLVEAECPTWDEFLARLDYPEIFMAWVWSLFQPDLKIRQIMWLHGGGNDGKTSVIGALREIFGAQYTASLSAGAEGKDWFFSDVYGKGFVTYADCQNQYLVSHIKIKNLTGGDPVQVEGKGIRAFSGRVRAHILVGSNHLPQINPVDESQVSRLIKLEVAPPAASKSKDSQFEARLLAEGFAFLNKCRAVGAKYINSNGIQIDLPKELQDAILVDCVSDDHTMLEEFIDDRLQFGPGKVCKVAQLGVALGMFLGEYNISSTKLKHYMASLDSVTAKRGCKKERITYKGNKIFAYTGFELKREERAHD